MSQNLFRKEVFNAQKTRWTGNIILSRPLSFSFLTLCALCIALIIVGFTFFGSYSKRSTVHGQLIPQSGLIQVYTTQPGIILNKNVYEGKPVQKGDILFVISTTRYSEQGDINAALMSQIKLKQQSIQNEITRMSLIHQNEKKVLLNQIHLSKENLIKINHLLIHQKNRVALAQINQKRYAKAIQQNATSYEQFEAKKIDFLNQVTQYEVLGREKNTQENQLHEQIITLSGLKNKQYNEIAQLQRFLSNNQQELIELQSKQRVVIHAQTTGFVSTVNTEVGQFVDLSKPLITILPKNTRLVAQLYVPSRAIGFVKVGDHVLLRYQAYSYQKFGHAKAKILSVAQTAMASQDLKTIGTISLKEQMNNEPVYLVRAQLEQQVLKAYGEDKALQVGMILEGDIMHERRKIYEWVLEPLYSITGKL